MIFEYNSIFIGILKVIIYKITNYNKVFFKSIPKMNCTFNIAMKKNTKLIIGKKFRSRNNISFRIYNNGIVKIGDNCFFNDNCSINCRKSIKIGKNVKLGQSVMIFDHDHDYKNDINNFICEDVIIGDNVWIGANCIILKGVKIGNNVVIAANTLVNKNIADNQMIYQKKYNIIKKYK